MAEVTDREREILDQVRAGANTPSLLASKLRISQSGASQALHKLAQKGQLTRRKGGRTVQYAFPEEGSTDQRYFLYQAYNALSQVWAYIMSSEPSRSEMVRAREARDTLEKILAGRK